jgi:folate-dependent phosphoribosylglycinamide formyltransferase PurN
VKVSRYELDTVETLSQRVLKFEHVLYSQVLRDIKRGLIDLDSKDF